MLLRWPQILEDVAEECAKCGHVVSMAVPVPPPGISDFIPSRVYVKFNATDAATKCKAMMDGRMFDENKITATHVTEISFQRAAAGEWTPTATG